MTEDMISQQQEVFANLGTSKEASQIRARMQSATLLSDMQSFKAANPDSVLEDFLKWYSPKDVNEDTSMSERMQSNDNLWKKTWEEAKPIPAHKQRKLFNPIREAELVLHYFETISIDIWMKQLLIGVFVVSYFSLRHTKAASLLPSISKSLDQLKEKLSIICSRTTM